jgi:hypothetical protein
MSGVIELLRELIVEGRVVIATRGGGPAGELAVTIVQPDGDVLQKLNPAAARSARFLEQHAADVRLRLAPAAELGRWTAKIERWLRRGTLGVAVAGTALGALDEQGSWWYRGLTIVVPWVVHGAVRLVARRVVSWVTVRIVGWLIGRALRGIRE